MRSRWGRNEFFSRAFLTFTFEKEKENPQRRDGRTARRHHTGIVCVCVCDSLTHTGILRRGIVPVRAILSQPRPEPMGWRRDANDRVTVLEVLNSSRGGSVAALGHGLTRLTCSMHTPLARFGPVAAHSPSRSLAASPRARVLAPPHPLAAHTAAAHSALVHLHRRVELAPRERNNAKHDRVR